MTPCCLHLLASLCVWASLMHCRLWPPPHPHRRAAPLGGHPTLPLLLHAMVVVVVVVMLLQLM